MSPRVVITVACILGTHGLLGCGQDAVPPGESLDALLESAPVLEVERVAIYGLSEGPEDDLTGPRFVGTDEDGSVYVLDWTYREGVTELKRFAPSGEFDRVVVRAGEGPFNWLRMEYPRNPPGLWVEGSDSIVIWNPPTAEVLVFDANGERLTRTSWRHIAEDFDIVLPQRRHQGEFLAYFRRTEPSPGVRPTTFEGYLRVREDGVVLDTVWSQRRPEDWILIRFDDRRSQVRVVRLPLTYAHARPFGSHEVLEVRAPEPSGGDRGRLTLNAFGDSGTVRSRALFYHPLSIPVADVKDEFLDARRDRYPRSVLRTLEQHLDLPRYAPPLLAAHGFPDGSIWLRLALTVDDLLMPSPDDRQEFLVIGLDDDVPARVSLPHTGDFSVDEKGRIWMTMSTESGEPYVASFVLRR